MLQLIKVCNLRFKYFMCFLTETKSRKTQWKIFSESFLVCPDVFTTNDRSPMSFNIGSWNGVTNNLDFRLSFVV